MPDNPNPPSLWDQLTGIRHSDVNLPDESGRIDPRLHDPAELVKAIASNPALQALKAYGLAALDQQNKQKAK